MANGFVVCLCEGLVFQRFLSDGLPVDGENLCPLVYLSCPVRADSFLLAVMLRLSTYRGLDRKGILMIEVVQPRFLFSNSWRGPVMRILMVPPVARAIRISLFCDGSDVRPMR